MRRFLALFLIFLFVLSAVPVKAETSYYAVSFDGDDYVDVGRSLEIRDRVTFVWFGKIVDAGADTEFWKNLAGQYVYTYGGFMLFWNSVTDAIVIYVKDSQGGMYAPVLEVSPQKNAVVMYAFSYDRISGDLKGYKNGEKIFSRSYSGLVDLGDLSKIKFGIQNNWGKWKGEVYAVMIYNRALSDTEIQQIYDNPNDPPRAGLILWYAPDSVDVANGLWRDKSGNGNDGTFVGATAERVSIPKLYVYDAATLNPIPYQDVSVTLIANNTTTSLIPSFLVLPHDSGVTLNISATNYESILLTTMSTVSTISVYLKPLQTQTTETDLEKPSLTFTNTPTSTIPITDDYGFKGAKLGELFVQGKWSDVYKQFWYYDPVAEIALPILLSLGVIIAGFIYTRNPLVPIGVTAITMTFFHELGLRLPISLIAPLASLFVFFVVWTLWDFYKRFERS